MNNEANMLIQETFLGTLGIGLSYFALVIVYRVFQMRNKEKMALIEKGMDPSLAGRREYNKSNNLKNGLVLIGLSIGIISGFAITPTITDFVAYPTMIFFFCGLALLYFYYLSRDRDQ